MRRPLILAAGGAAVAVAAAGFVIVMTASPPAPVLPVAHTAAPPVTHTAVPPVAHTTLSIRQWKTTITSGQQATISGQLMAGTTPLAREVVFLYRVADGELYQVGRAQLTSQAGKPWFTVQPGTTTTYELVFRGTQTLAPAHSGDITITVG